MLRFTACGLALFLLGACPVIAGAADPKPAALPAAPAAWTSAEQIQTIRNEVGKTTGKEAGADALRQGALRLEEALVYLDRPDVRELGTGSPYLYFRGHDVRYDLARLYARLGMKAQAIAALDAAQRYVWMPDMAARLAKDEAFAGLRGEPGFEQVLRRSDIAGRLWKGPAADVPYRDKLGVEERIAGLTQFWSEARASFAYFDHVPELDWDRVYLDYLPKVMAAESTRDYYQVLMQLAPLLRDGHTNIYPPKELAPGFFTRPPLATVLVEDRVLVERVDSAALRAKVAAGDEIVAIDGMPVHRYAEERVAPYVSASTGQDRKVRTYSYQLLAGDAARPVALTLRDAAGRERTVEVARGGYGDVKKPAPFALRMLPGGIAYFALDHLESKAAVSAFEQALPEIMKAKALVIDVRANGGGSTGFGWDILCYLSSTPIPNAPQYVRADDPYLRAQGGAGVVIWKPLTSSTSRAAVPARPQVFGGKVAVLTGPRTFSAAEDFVLAFNGLKRGVTVGESTAGSTGQPLFMQLPGGGMARICVKRDLAPDGRDFVGTGIAPDVPASQTVQAARAGRDLVLERALAALGGG